MLRILRDRRSPGRRCRGRAGRALPAVWAGLWQEGRLTGLRMVSPGLAATQGLSRPLPFPDAERVPSRGLRVALVNMPWSRADAPSIQCGLLQALTRRAGHHCDVFYL